MALLDQQKLSSEEQMQYFQDVLSKMTLSKQDIGLQLGFTPKYFDAMYAIGAKYYENNRLDDAIKIFYQLIPIQPSASRNYKALGACLQVKEDYDSAIQAYKGAVTFAAMDAEIYFYVGQCLFLKKNFVEAAKTLNLVNNMCAKRPEQWSHIAHHAKELHARALERSAK